MPLIPNKPLCRFYYSKKLKNNDIKSCKKNCLFYHPDSVNEKDSEEFGRDVGYCYCGAPLITIVNKNNYNEDCERLFMVVCGKTFKGKNRCRKA